MSELDVTDAETNEKATYAELQAYVQENANLHVTTLQIAQVKRKLGIMERACYNKAKHEDSRQPQCPDEKERVITEALKHFGMVPLQ